MTEGYSEVGGEKKKAREQMMQTSKHQSVLLLLNTGEEVTGLGSPSFCFIGGGGR